MNQQIESYFFLKKNCTIRLVLFLLTVHLVCAIAFAQNKIVQTNPSDYAYRGQLAASSSKVQSIRIPKEIFISATREDMLDIAVFDRNLKRLPSGLEVEESPPAIWHQRELEINRQVATDNSQSANNNTYLIDLSGDKTHPAFRQVELHWTLDVSEAPKVELVAIRSRFKSSIFYEKILPITELQGVAAPSGRRTTIQTGGGDQLRLTVLGDSGGFRLNSAIGHYPKRRSIPNPIHRIETTRVFHKGAIFFEFNKPSEAKPSSLRFIADRSTPLSKGEIFAGNHGIESKLLLNSQIRYSSLDSAESLGAFSPSDNWSQFWFLPKNTVKELFVEFSYRNLVVTFISNGNGPYTLAWGNYQEPMKIDGLTIWDVDLMEAYPPAEVVKIKTMEISGSESRLGGLAEGIATKILNDRQ